MQNTDTLNVDSEIRKIEDQLVASNEKIREMSGTDITQRPAATETEPQTKISAKEVKKMPDNYLVPVRRIDSAQRFNEKFRKDYEFQKEYVQFIAENAEIGGEPFNMWTRPFGGMHAEEWRVPVNKPVWGPRYLAEQITRCKYRKLRMSEKDMTPTGADGFGTYHGAIAVEETVQRLNARPATDNRKSIFSSGSF